MSLTYNGTEVDKIVYDGTEVEKVVYNDVTVWESLVETTEVTSVANSLRTANDTITATVKLSHTPIEDLTQKNFKISGAFGGFYQGGVYVTLTGILAQIKKSTSKENTYIVYITITNSIYSSSETLVGGKIEVTYKYKP